MELPVSLRTDADTDRNANSVRKQMKRIGIIVGLALLVATSAGATITAVGTTSGTGVVSITPVAGHLLVATVRNVTKGANSVSVTDSSGQNVWQRAISCANNAVDDDEIWYAVAVRGATYSVSFANVATGAANLPGTVTEWAGAGNLTVTGACGTSASATTTVTGGIITTPNNTDLLISDWASADSSSTQSARTCVSCTTTPTTWTSIASSTSAPSGESARMILTAAGSAQYQITTASAVNYAAAEAAFVATAPVASATPTPSPTPIPTNTATITPTAVPSFTPSVTPTAEPTAIPGLINSQGNIGAPITVPACNGSASATILTGRRVRVSYAFMPEGTDIRCTNGTTANGAPRFVPNTTIGFLFKSNVMYTEQTSQSAGSAGTTLRIDCCGVGGTVSVDTWEEPPASTPTPTQTATPTQTPTATPT